MALRTIVSPFVSSLNQILNKLEIFFIFFKFFQIFFILSNKLPYLNNLHELLELALLNVEMPFELLWFVSEQPEID